MQTKTPKQQYEDALIANGELAEELAKLLTENKVLQAHQGDPCVYCGTPHDKVEVGPCPGTREVLAEKLQEAQATNQHIREWWSSRFKRLEDFARQELKGDLCTRFFSIVANGNPDTTEQHSYERELVLRDHEIERLKKSLAALQALYYGGVELLDEQTIRIFVHLPRRPVPASGTLGELFPPDYGQDFAPKAEAEKAQKDTESRLRGLARVAMTERADDLRAELDAASKACAEMRKALIFALTHNHADNDHGKTFCHGHECRVCDSINNALSSDCGKDFIDVHALKNPVCTHCGKPATCVGRYEDPDGPIEFACDECCGHGNEDGWCHRITNFGQGYVKTEAEKLRQALEGLLNHYLQLVNSGDAGNWDPEKEAEVIAARQALTKG